eukprot:CAMPEP_0173124784 /NCGR_PEP_ID=MMETSP1102-20130122/55925_1 /TAXON_ID=49646 /ORGANISM="Geminigera sp., Strain Caron Lab Isolate" /LENGTH=1042 /DNA_ID=CAMNT_0014033323 /DNA_START=324 /DNA_END=3453 /DNA_ORIENTATION=+
MPLGKQVGFQVRYEKRIDKDTKIKVMTDGILLKEIQSDFLLSDYYVVDEAHERGINSDVLIGLLSRLVPLRRKGMTKDGRLLPPLKLIIMSATLRVTDFTENAPLFPVPPPVVEVSARQHPVTVHFNRRTPIFTYMQEALKKACKIHRKLPGGGILIFLTGRREIDWMCRNLREELAQHKNRSQKPKARPQLRDGAFTAAGPNAGEKRKIKDETATGLEGEEKTEESGHKEAFLFGQDDGADSDVDDADAAEDGADYDDDDEAEEKALRADDDESSEDEDLLDDEYDLSESEEEGAEHDSDEESEDEEAKSKRTVLLDGAALAKGAAGLTGNDIGSATRRTPTATVAKEADKPTDAAQSDAPKRAKVSKRPSKVLVLPERRAETRQSVKETLKGARLAIDSMLSGPQQLKAFNRAPKGVRVIVVATNVAETSITIPGMRYVVDTGRVKERVYQKRSGVGTFAVNWASQASVNQRAGRAGRTGPGHCYRLFSSAVFENQFMPFAPPQILSSPIEGIMLQMKAMGIPDVRHFPYPTPPDEDDVDRALKTLMNLGALTPEEEEVTPLGRQLAAFPLAPRFAKMLVLGHQGGCLPYAVSMVAALSVENPIVYDRADATAEDSEPEEGQVEDEGDAPLLPAETEGTGSKRRADGKGEAGGSVVDNTDDANSKRGAKMAGLKCRRDLWWHSDGDILALVKAFGAYAFSNGSDDFAATHGLQPKLMSEMLSLAGQLQGIIRMYYPALTAALGIPPAGKKKPTTAASLGLKAPPTSAQESLLRQIALAGLVDHVATRDPDVRGPLTGYKCLAYDNHVFVHQHSCMRKQPAEWICFLELSETSRVYMKGVTPIQAKWLPRLAPSMVERTQPLEVPPVRYDAQKDDLMCVTAPLFGQHGWELPPQTGPLPDGPDRYKHFARLLLDGKVLPGFAILSPWLNDRPSMLARTWATPKVSRLLSSLQLKRVSTRKGLEEAWAMDATFLLKEVALWVRKEHHQTLQRLWPLTDVPGAGVGKGIGGKGEKYGAKKEGEDAVSRGDEFASGTDSGEESD